MLLIGRILHKTFYYTEIIYIFTYGTKGAKINIIIMLIKYNQSSANKDKLISHSIFPLFLFIILNKQIEIRRNKFEQIKWLSFSKRF